MECSGTCPSSHVAYFEILYRTSISSNWDTEEMKATDVQSPLDGVV